jgi:hypothetical protein
VDRLLAGHASEATREILASGHNPMLERGEAANDALRDDTANEMAGGAGPLRGRRAGFGAPPQLSGVAQLVGLALGSPEFQRR